MKTATLLLASLAYASAKSTPLTKESFLDSLKTNTQQLLTATNCGGTSPSDYTTEMTKCATDYASACLNDLTTCAKATTAAGVHDCKAADFVQTYATCTRKAMCAYAGGNGD